MISNTTPTRESVVGLVGIYCDMYAEDKPRYDSKLDKERKNKIIKDHIPVIKECSFDERWNIMKEAGQEEITKYNKVFYNALFTKTEQKHINNLNKLGKIK